MKIEYKQVGGGAWTTLMDEAVGGTSEQCRFPCRSINQNEPLASNGGPGSAYLNSLGNTTCMFQWRGNVTYGSYALAFQAVKAINLALVGYNNHLRITHGGEVIYLPNAVCDTFDPDVKGVAVDYNIQWTTNNLTGTVPTT